MTYYDCGKGVRGTAHKPNGRRGMWVRHPATPRDPAVHDENFATLSSPPGPDGDLSPMECRILALLSERADLQVAELARMLDVPVFTVVCRLPRLMRKLGAPTSPHSG